MNKPESWKTWVPLLGLLVVFALLTAVWPALSNAFDLTSLGGGASTSIPYEPEPIHLEGLKTAIPFLPLPDTISPFIAVVAVTALTVALVIGAGGGLAFLFKSIAGLRDSTIESSAFQEHQNALDQQVKAQIESLREGRTTDPKPEHTMPRWNVISNALIILMFVGFASIVVVRNFFPEGITEIDGRIVNVTTPVFGLFALITLIILGLRLRPQKIEAVEKTDYGKIPWDFIAVLITGLIMLGLGVGFMAYLNASG